MKVFFEINACLFKVVLKKNKTWDAGAVLPDARFTLSFAGLKEVDWEVELAFVIGRRGKHIKVSIMTLAPTT